MNSKFNAVYLKNAARMFRNIELVKMEVKEDENGRQYLELIFYKRDDSEFNLYGASGKMLKDALIEAVDYQFNQYRVLALNKNTFAITIETK